MLSATGHAGFVLALCGFSVIAGPDAVIFGMGIYWVGAPVIGLGMLLLSVAQLGAEPRNGFIINGYFVATRSRGSH